VSFRTFQDLLHRVGIGVQPFNLVRLQSPREFVKQLKLKCLGADPEGMSRDKEQRRLVVTDTQNLAGTAEEDCPANVACVQRRRDEPLKVSR
jgi:hypothetical protein